MAFEVGHGSYGLLPPSSAFLLGMEVAMADETMDEVMEFVEENDVKFIRLAFCDIFPPTVS